MLCVWVKDISVHYVVFEVSAYWVRDLPGHHAERSKLQWGLPRHYFLCSLISSQSSFTLIHSPRLLGRAQNSRQTSASPLTSCLSTERGKFSVSRRLDPMRMMLLSQLSLSPRVENSGSLCGPLWSTLSDPGPQYPCHPSLNTVPSKLPDTLPT